MRLGLLTFGRVWAHILSYHAVYGRHHIYLEMPC